MKVKVQLTENKYFEGENLTEDHVTKLIEAFANASTETRYAESLSPLQRCSCESEYLTNEIKSEERTVESTSSGFGVKIGEIIQNTLKKQHANEDNQKKIADPVDEVKSANVKDGYVENQDYYETGIKYKTIKGVPNVPTYRCHWECPNPVCNDRGNHYITEGTQVVYCYTCNTAMQVEEATVLGFPNRDSWGNFYVATEEVEQ